MAEDVVHAAGGGQAQRGGAGEAVHRGPYRVAGHLRRVGEEQEGPADQCRIKEVLPGAAEHFLAQHHAEADPQGYLPQRDGRRQGQGEQHRGDEEAFVDLVAADAGEQHLPETADDEGGQVHRQEVRGALDQAIPQAVRVEPGQRADQGEAPAILGAQQVGALGEDQVGLVADVVHAEEHRREGA